MTNVLTVRGQQYPIVITVADERRITEATNCRLASLLDDNCAGLIELVNDFPAFANVIWVLIQRQAAAANMTEDEYLNSLDGDTMTAAQEVFVESIARFFGQGGRGTLIRRMWTKAMEATEMATSRAAEAVANVPIEQVLQYMTSGSTVAAASPSLATA